jgi:hypothetical protein
MTTTTRKPSGNNSTSRGLIFFIFSFILIFGLVVYVLRELKVSDERKESAERAISILPQGVEDAWNTWVDADIATKIDAQGKVLQVHTLPGTGPVYISKNMPFTVNCAFSIRIDFGSVNSDDRGTEIWISSPQMSVTGMPLREAPALGVRIDSIAAEALQERLCARVTSTISRLMQ